MTTRLAHETIFSGRTTVIPMCEVRFVRRDLRPEWKGAVTVCLEGTKVTPDGLESNAVWLDPKEGATFMRAWCDFRSEVDPVVQGAPDVASDD